MKESAKVIKEGTWNERLMLLVKDHGKPIQAASITRILNSNGFQLRQNNFGIYILNACNKGFLKKLKYKGMPTFYCYPGWWDGDGLKDGYEHNPITREFKKLEYEEK